MKKFAAFFVLTSLALFSVSSQDMNRDKEVWQSMTPAMKLLVIDSLYNGAFARHMFSLTVLRGFEQEGILTPEQREHIGRTGLLFTDKIEEYEHEFWVEAMDRFYFRRENVDAPLPEAFWKIVMQELGLSWW